MNSASSLAPNMATAIRRPTVNAWIIAIIVVVPTFMEILDTTIANVALRYFAGGLSAAQSDADWVITGCLVANAIVLRTRDLYYQWSGDPSRSQQMGYEALNGLREQQATAMAFFEQFHWVRLAMGGLPLNF